MPQDLCRVCLKRPEIPDESHGRCDVCVGAHRQAFKFRLGLDPTGHSLMVKSGELSPRALKQKWHGPLAAFAGKPSAKSHLGLHEIEMIVTKDKIDTIRMSADLENRSEDILPLLRAASDRADASW